MNLEKALRAHDRLGGHIVSGHVDGMGRVTHFAPVGESFELRILAPRELAKYLAYKGSITVNGVSLTVNTVTDQAEGCEISINLIPHTVQNTALHALTAGAQVNLEIDLIARYVERMLSAPASQAQEAMVNVAVLSMGNPHAVQLVGDVDTAPVLDHGPLIERHPAFPNRVNAGFLQIVDRGHVRLRVYERGAGETLACGTGACAAVVAGIRIGLLDHRVDVQARGGQLTIEWAGGMQDHVFMTGPATTVFEGSIELPDSLSNPA